MNAISPGMINSILIPCILTCTLVIRPAFHPLDGSCLVPPCGQKQGEAELFSAGVQIGHFHVNTKTNAEVIAQMGNHGFLYDTETTQRLRAHCKLPWLSQTVMVFHNVTVSQ